ncbi:MAG: methylenetetrahydrofolate reductase [Clostridia bacterium]|nr:methylenetetrahydrofolate reductase [Clostridia bacterium]
MHIADILKSKTPTVSCELFPPKQGTDLERACEVVKETAKLKPDFISVTYGAGGSVPANMLEMAKLVRSCGVEALAHLTCVSSTKEKINEFIGELEASGIENILALRGDIPEGYKFEEGVNYKYAYELVSEIKAHGGFSIGAACYPEGHPECENQNKDLENLKIKVDAGCDFLTTQMFFDNDMLYRFLYRALSKGIDVPVLAGIMPVTNKKQIKKMVALSGQLLPSRFMRIVDKFGDDPVSMEQAGIAYATEQIIDLIANGVRGVHIYSMNRPDIAGKIMANINYLWDSNK